VHYDPDDLLSSSDLVIAVKGFKLEDLGINIEFGLVNAIRSIKHEETNVILYPLGVIRIKPVSGTDVWTDEAVGRPAIEVLCDADDPRCCGDLLKVVDGQKNGDPAPVSIKAVGVLCHSGSRVLGASLAVFEFRNASLFPLEIAVLGLCRLPILGAKFSEPIGRDGSCRNNRNRLKREMLLSKFLFKPPQCCLWDNHIASSREIKRQLRTLTQEKLKAASEAFFSLKCECYAFFTYWHVDLIPLVFPRPAQFGPSRLPWSFSLFCHASFLQ
jgi:hypothetical protein